MSEEHHPWERLEELIHESRTDEVRAFLDSLSPGEAARALSRLRDEHQVSLLTQLAPEGAAQLIKRLSDVQAADLIENLPAAEAAAIVEELPSADRADLVGELEPKDADAILSELPPKEAEELRSLTSYPGDVAGGLMITEYLSYPETWTVAKVIDDLRRHADRYRDYEVQYAYVTGRKKQLIGVLRLRDLLLARPEEPVASLMLSRPLNIVDTTGLDQLQEVFEKSPFFGVPVTDAEGTLLGVLRRSAVEEALGDRAASDYRKSQGVIREELRTMPLLTRSRRRLAWLSVNIGLNVIAASVIALYQETLAQVVALAVFLPIISDMSGCSGGQAVAVSMRELTLGLVTPQDMFRVWRKEVLVGALNGVALGALIAVVAWLWKGNVFLGLIVGTAMSVNTVVAVSLGGTLPLFLKRLGMDPAVASGPLLTTVTDMCGFFLSLSLAAALLSRLAGV